MPVQISMKPKVMLLSLFVGVVAVLVCIFMILQLDYLVNHTLYEFGLQFNSAWAEPYWTYAKSTLGLLGLAAVVDCVSAAYIQVCERRGVGPKPWAVGTFLLIGTSALLVSAFFFTQIDVIVHGDLYQYGLQFSQIWANQYWTYARSTLSLTGVVVVTNGASIAYILAAPFTINLNPSESVKWLLMASGSVSLFLSVIFDSSVLAFIGLGLIFWGAIMLYVRPHRYVQERILATTVLPSFMNINHMIKNLGYKGPAVYLPPKYLKDIGSSKAYISAEKNVQLPASDQTQQEEALFLKEPDGILLTPLGAELTRLFEKILGKSFTEVDLDFLVQNIPRVIVEDLEIAQNIDFSVEDSKIHVKMEGLACKDMNIEAQKLSIFDNSLGHPISSAIACALAKATGKFTIIEKETISEDGQAMDVEYSLLEEP